jgi:hypothetical protein
LWKECFAALLVKKAFETNGFVNDCDIVLKASNSYRQGQDFISEFIADRVISSPGKNIQKTELTADFNSWYQNTYGAKGAPSIKDVQAYMDKKFGKFEVNKYWKDVAINYNGNNAVPPNTIQNIDDNDYDDIDENDL